MTAILEIQEPIQLIQIQIPQAVARTQLLEILETLKRLATHLPAGLQTKMEQALFIMPEILLLFRAL